MAVLTPDGIQILRLEQIINELENGFRQIYGNNINLDADTPDGQLIGILAQMRMDYEELAENVYKQLDPDLATGAWLEQRVAYAGLNRKQASYSYLRSAILTGEPNATIYAGVLVSDQNKVKWRLVQDVVLNAQGSAQADFRSEELGAFNLGAKTALTIETVTLGLNSVTSNENAEIGSEEETDTQLRRRFFVSRAKNAQNSVLAMEAEINALPDVEQVVVLENNTAIQDKNEVGPHSLNVIVQGGKDEQIADVIFENKGAGVGLQGARVITLNRFDRPREIRFDRATPIDISVSLRLVRYEDFTEIDKDEIKRLLSAQKFTIGKSVSLSRLYSPINTVGGFWVKELRIARKGQALKNDNVVIQPREFARILSADIEIEVE